MQINAFFFLDSVAINGLEIYSLKFNFPSGYTNLLCAMNIKIMNNDGYQSTVINSVCNLQLIIIIYISSPPSFVRMLKKIGIKIMILRFHFNAQKKETPKNSKTAHNYLVYSSNSIFLEDYSRSLVFKKKKPRTWFQTYLKPFNTKVCYFISLSKYLHDKKK